MADKKMGNMPGMDMGGMKMGGTIPPSKNTDPTKNQKGMDTPPPPVRTPGFPMTEGMKNMPMISPPRVWTVTGTENWSLLRGFGAATGMVNMMNEMMVAGSPMGAMKMGNMNYKMTEIPAPTPEEARTVAQTEPASTPSDLVTLSSSPNPPHVGDNTISIFVKGADGQPVTGLHLTATVAMTTMDMGTTHPPVMEMGDGHYMTKAVFAMEGPWKVTVSGNGADQSMVFAAGSKTPQPETDTQAQPAQSKAPAGALQVSATIAPAPPAVGKSNVMTVSITDGTGQPVSNAVVTSTVTMATMDMGTTHPIFKSIGGGKYQGKVVFGMNGPWRVVLGIAVPGQKPTAKTIVFSAK